MDPSMYCQFDVCTKSSAFLEFEATFTDTNLCIRAESIRSLVVVPIT